MKEKKYLKKATIGMFLVFIVFGILLVFLFGFGVPVLLKFNTEIYSAGQTILEDINTTNLPQEMQEAINASTQSVSTQTEILSFFFQYGWIIILIVILFVLFMRSRTLVEAEIR